jgi:ribosomal protein L11 methyltransferase
MAHHRDPAGRLVLDYGCGSGILAIAAARLGAGEVTGVDIDEKAVETAADNAANNDVSLRLQVSANPLRAPSSEWSPTS